MINSKPWVVTAISLLDGHHYPSPDKLKFGTRSEAEMYCQSLNKISSTITYKVVFDESQILIA